MERTLQQTNSNCIKVVLFGPESTGKSTLAKELADHYNSIYIEEYAREYLQKKYDLNQEEISHIEKFKFLSFNKRKNKES